MGKKTSKKLKNRMYLSSQVYEMACHILAYNNIGSDSYFPSVTVLISAVTYETGFFI